METRALTLGLSAALLALLVVGCAGFESYGTGLPAEAAPKFFFHMEHEAEARGFDVYRSSSNDYLSVTTDLGDMDYRVEGDEIVVSVQLADVEGLTAEELRVELDRLRALNDELIDAAAKRAERSRAFERRTLDGGEAASP